MKNNFHRELLNYYPAYIIFIVWGLAWLEDNSHENSISRQEWT